MVKPSRNQKSPENIWELASLFPPERWQAPVILAIDEAQSFEGGRSTHAGFLRSIRNSDSNLPLLLVLAGLGDTAAQASAMDLTKGKEVHEIGSLDPEDAGEFMLTYCRRYGIDPRGTKKGLWNWRPRVKGGHVICILHCQALGREILQAEGDLGKVSWEYVKKEAGKSRIRYYQNQQSKAMEEVSYLVGMVLGNLHQPIRRQDVINSISNHAGSKSGVEWQLPAGMDARTFADHLIHQGALLEREDHTISFAIPSFRSYLVRTGGLNLPEPSDDMIRQARNQCRIHRKALREWREQVSLLESEFQSAEQDITRKRDEIEKIGILSFKRKRQLQEDLAKGEERFGPH